MPDPNWLSILPPILAIVLAIWTKQVLPSLFAGIWLGFTILQGGNPLTGVTAGLDGIIHVFTDPGDAKVLVFTLLIGALIATTEHSGGVRGLVRFLESRRWVHTRVRAQILAWVIGLLIFIEANITLLVAGSVCRPLFDRYRISREKLAYLIDATSAPVCAMIPLNAWGAVIVGLLATTEIENPLAAFTASIPFNLYAIIAILLAAVVIWKNVDLGPMRAAEQRTADGHVLWPDATPTVGTPAAMPQSAEANEASADVPSAGFMVWPMLAMLLMMPTGLYLTGDGNLIEGSGSTSILWAVSAGLLVAWVMLLATRRADVNELMTVFMQGAGNLLPVATIMLLALALGDVAQLLGTGPYVAGLASATVPEFVLAPLIFLVSSFIAFSVGSSWGTFAIMIPIAVPIATNLDLPVPLLLGAAISGAIFGDHSSPISDTTVLASMASGTNHIDHVRTQLPYALLAAAIATLGFLLLGLAM